MLTDHRTEWARTQEADSRFRDPEPPEARARVLRLAIAKTLVRAPELPVELPAFGLRLIDVDADKRGIELILGLDAPIAALRLVEAAAPDGASAGGAAAVVDVSVRTIDLAAHRFKAALEKMAERMKLAVDAAKWSEAREHARALLRLPRTVPLHFHRQLVAGIEATGIVRTGFLCNQDCGLCWQGRDWGTFGAEQVLRWIEDLRRAGARELIISGGEPTLDPDLERYVARAKELGFSPIVLETNAIQLSKPGRVEKLRAAGLTQAFVSLHSGDAETSDAITRAPGTFVKTVAGVLELLKGGVAVTLNTVMTREGLDHLAALPDFIHDTFGAYRAGLRALMFSYPTASYDAALNASIMPEPARLREVLRETLARAFTLGLVPDGLDGPCGPPLCVFDADPRITSLAPVKGPVDFRLHVAACDTCAVRDACFGVRSLDVELFGDACAFPLAARPAPAAR